MAISLCVFVCVRARACVFHKQVLNGSTNVHGTLHEVRVTFLTLYIPCIVSNYINKPTKCTFCMYLFYNFCTAAKHGFVQSCRYSKSWTPDDERNGRSKRVELQKDCRINTYKKVHLVGLFVVFHLPISEKVPKTSNTPCARRLDTTRTSTFYRIVFESVPIPSTSLTVADWRSTGKSQTWLTEIRITGYPFTILYYQSSVQTVGFQWHFTSLTLHLIFSFYILFVNLFLSKLINLLTNKHSLTDK